MKPTSIIFIVISLLIILAGHMICKNAEERAIEEGIEIFGQTLDENNNSVYTFVFGEEEIYNKLELNLDEAEVFIYGGYAEPYIELYNFDEGSYTMTTTNRNISVNTSIDIMSMVMFWESGFKFDGLRNYIERGTEEEVVMEKKVNIYLPTDGDLNVINVTLNKGNVHVSNLNTSIDLSMTVGSGDVVFTGVETESYIKTEIKKGDFYLSDVVTGSLTAVMDEGDINARNFNFNNVSVTGTKANVFINTAQSPDFFDMHLSARRGIIRINDEELGDRYNYESSAQGDSTVIITVTEGNIILTQDNLSFEDNGAASDSGTDTDPTV